jgi:hypothetical protein
MGKQSLYDDSMVFLFNLNKRESMNHQYLQGTGKWSLSEVPHRGWMCVNAEDLEEDRMICEMCESQEIRYVHHMEHPEYSEVLKVGRTCAARMEEDLVTAKKRETILAKKGNWMTCGWIHAGKGVFKACARWVVEVYKRDQGWKVTIQTKSEVIQPEQKVHQENGFATMQEAKLYAFDYMYPLALGKPAT